MMTLFAISLGRTLVSALLSGLALAASANSAAQDATQERSERPVLRELPGTVEECLTHLKNGGNPAVELAQQDVSRALALQREATLKATQQAVEAHAVLRHSDQYLAAAEERIARVRQHHAAGVTSIREVLEAENARTAALRDLAVARANAQYLIGGGLGEEGEVEVPDDLEAMLELLLERNPAIREARLRVTLALEQKRTTRLEVARDVRCQFHEVRVLRGAEEVLRQHLVTVEAMVKQAVSSTAELLDARSQLLKVGADRTRAEAELRYLLGMHAWSGNAP